MTGSSPDTVSESVSGTVSAARPLVVGYGNPLRGDDALGWRAALAIANDSRFVGVDVLARHQLTPELAVDIAAASRVVFIDACDARASSGPPEIVRVLMIAAESATPAWTHHLDAASLLGWAEALYGAAPPAVLVTAPAASLEMSEQLSADGERVLVALVRAVSGLLIEGRREGAGDA